MTGSGKTGLCLALLEEAAIDGIPAICHRSQGRPGQPAADLPESRGRRTSAPGSIPAEAARQGLSPDEYAAKTAENLAQRSGGMGPGRRAHPALARCAPTSRSTRRAARRACRFLCCGRLRAPPQSAQAEDRPRFAIGSQPRLSGLLGLLGIDADPLKSREHILLVDICSTSAGVPASDLDRRGADPRDPEAAVRQGRRVRPGDVLPGQGAHSQLAMAVNNLLASPGFAAWMEGEPLDVQRLLFTRGGQAAHLDPVDRASLRCRADVLRDDAAQEVIAWMRDQTGHFEPARTPVHGRDLRLLPADGECRPRRCRC